MSRVSTLPWVCPALAHDGELDLCVHRTAHLLDRLVQGQSLHLVVVELDDDVVGDYAGLRAGVSSIGATTLISPSSIVTSMPSPPNSPRVCTCMSRKLLESM